LTWKAATPIPQRTEDSPRKNLPKVSTLTGAIVRESPMIMAFLHAVTLSSRGAEETLRFQQKPDMSPQKSDDYGLPPRGDLGQPRRG